VMGRKKRRNMMAPAEDWFDLSLWQLEKEKWEMMGKCLKNRIKKNFLPIFLEILISFQGYWLYLIQ
jgi:hypothetical protein